MAHSDHDEQASTNRGLDQSRFNGFLAEGDLAHMLNFSKIGPRAFKPLQTEENQISKDNRMAKRDGLRGFIGGMNKSGEIQTRDLSKRKNSSTPKNASCGTPGINP